MTVACTVGIVGARLRQHPEETVNADEARDLLARLLHGIAPEVDLDSVDPSAPLQEEAELDSMDFLDLVNALHEETGIEIPERDYPQVATVDGFVAYVVAASA